MSITSIPDNIAFAFSGGIGYGQYIIYLIGFLLAGGITLILAIPALRNVVLPRFKETFLSDYIACKKVLPDAKTLLCESGIHARIFEIPGISQTFLSEEDQQKFYLLRKQWLDALGDLPIDIRSFTFRKPVLPVLSLLHSSKVLQGLTEKWCKHFTLLYSNSHYIVLNTEDSKKAEEVLQAVADITLSTLSQFGAKELTQEDGELLHVLARITSPITNPAPKGIGEGVAETICTDKVVFTGQKGIVEFSHGNETKYMAVYAIRKMASYSSTEFIDSILSLPIELTLFQNVRIHSKINAMSTLEFRKGLSLDSASGKRVISEKFNSAIERVEGFDSDAAMLCEYSMAICAYASSIEALNEQQNTIEKVVREYGFAPVREGVMAEVTFFSQMPGGKMTRARRVFTDNVATSITFSNDPIGMQASQWMHEPIAIFRTAYGNPYFFQFHIANETGEDTGHGIACGRTGSGKTTVLQFLAGQALRNEKLKVFFFDRYEGTYVFSQAIEGNYIYFDGAKANCQLNPLHLEDTPRNREFLQLWLKIISGCDDPESIDEIASLVGNIFDPHIQLKNKKLSWLIEGLNPNSELYRHLKPWADPEQYGHYFNADVDSLSFSGSRWFSFDFTHLLNNKVLAEAIIPYIMHRIVQSLMEEGCPSLIIIDETAPLLQSELMRKWFFTMLQEFRKLDSAVYSCFQRPEALDELGITQLIRGQAPTRLFFPDSQAKPEDYASFNFTDTEIGCLTGESPIVQKILRPVLLQKGEETVLLQADLSPIGEYLKLFSGQKAVREVKALKERHGSEWLPQFLGVEQ